MPGKLQDQGQLPVAFGDSSVNRIVFLERNKDLQGGLRVMGRDSFVNRCSTFGRSKLNSGSPNTKCFPSASRCPRLSGAALRSNTFCRAMETVTSPSPIPGDRWLYKVLSTSNLSATVIRSTLGPAWSISDCRSLNRVAGLGRWSGGCDA